jgi:hypothetical protein
MDRRAATSFADFSYSINPRWRAGISATYNSFAGSTGLISSYNDLEIAIGRSLGEALQNQALALVWSKSRNKFRVEIRTSRL